MTHSDRYVRDPWSIGELSNQEIGSVLLVGSGLTMIDAALRLAALRPRVRHIHVLSRHGWMPQSQASDPSPAIKPDVSRALDAARGSTRRLVTAFRALTRAVDDAGGDWREVLALARGQFVAQWRALDQTQRARFLRHARSAWDVNRHRVPAGPLGAVRTLARVRRARRARRTPRESERTRRRRRSHLAPARRGAHACLAGRPRHQLHRPRVPRRSPGGSPRAVPARRAESSAPTRCRSASTSPMTAGRFRATASR